MAVGSLARFLFILFYFFKKKERATDSVPEFLWKKSASLEYTKPEAGLVPQLRKSERSLVQFTLVDAFTLESVPNTVLFVGGGEWRNLRVV